MHRPTKKLLKQFSLLLKVLLIKVNFYCILSIYTVEHYTQHLMNYT